MRRVRSAWLGVPSVGCLLLASTAKSEIVGFVETFAEGPAAWRNGGGTAVLEWSATGGPLPEMPFVSSSFDLSNTTPGGFPPVVIRAQQAYGSSEGAYVGNWLAAGVTGVQFWFRHDLPEAVTVTGRFAGPQNFPGASAESSIEVAPDLWTLVAFDLREGSPEIVSLGGGTYAGVFSSIANIQIGFVVPSELAGQPIPGRFDLTEFAIVPAPPAVALLLLGAGASRGRRRR